MNNSLPVVHRCLTCHYAVLYSKIVQLKHAPNLLDGRIVRWADGDTAIVLLRLGWGVWVEKYLRIEGIDSWELDGHDAARAQEVRATLDTLYGWRECKALLSLDGLDCYGRWVGTLYIDGKDIRDEITERGLAWWRAGRQPARGPHNAKLAAKQSSAPGATNLAAVVLLLSLSALAGCAPLWQSGGSVFVSTHAATTNAAPAIVNVTQPGASHVEARDRARVATETEHRTDNRPFSFRVLLAGAAIGAALAAAAWLALKLFAKV